MEERLKSHYESLQRAIGFTRTADRKAAPVIALQVALAGVLAARMESLAPILVQCHWDAERIVLVCVASLYGISTIASVAIAVCVYIPVYPKADGSLIYFKDIAAMRYQQFEELSMQMTPEEIERQLLAQIHRVSKIASRKMRRVSWAFVSGAISGVSGIALLGWGSFQSASL